MSPLSPKQAEARAQRFQRQLNACTKGLLEAKTIPGVAIAELQVDFLHSTVNDYVKRENNRVEFSKSADASFDCFARLTNAYIMKLKTGHHNFHRFEGVSRLGCMGTKIVDTVVRGMFNASRMYVGSGGADLHVRLVNHLDDAASYLAGLDSP